MKTVIAALPQTDGKNHALLVQHQSLWTVVQEWPSLVGPHGGYLLLGRQEWKYDFYYELQIVVLAVVEARAITELWH